MRREPVGLELVAMWVNTAVTTLICVPVVWVGGVSYLATRVEALEGLATRILILDITRYESIMRYESIIAWGILLWLIMFLFGPVFDLFKDDCDIQIFWCGFVGVQGGGILSLILLVLLFIITFAMLGARLTADALGLPFWLPAVCVVAIIGAIVAVLMKPETIVDETHHK